MGSPINYNSKKRITCVKSPLYVLYNMTLPLTNSDCSGQPMTTAYNVVEQVELQMTPLHNHRIKRNMSDVS